MGKIVEDLEAALEQFREIAADSGESDRTLENLGRVERQKDD